jgi:hypothetical protein
MTTGLIVTVDSTLPKLLNPANASILKNRLDVGRYRNPLGASSVRMGLPFPVINCNQSEVVFSLRFMVGNASVRISGAVTVTSKTRTPFGISSPNRPIAYTQ